MSTFTARALPLAATISATTLSAACLLPEWLTITAKPLTGFVRLMVETTPRAYG
jgi:hypothetical protein